MSAVLNEKPKEIIPDLLGRIKEIRNTLENINLKQGGRIFTINSRLRRETGSEPPNYKELAKPEDNPMPPGLFPRLEMEVKELLRDLIETEDNFNEEISQLEELLFLIIGSEKEDMSPPKEAYKRG